MKKYTLSIALFCTLGLYCFPHEAQAAFPPEFYEQRRLEREQAKEQVNADEFDRMHSGAMRVLRGGKGNGIVLEPPLAYVVRENTVLPPLTDTGANTPLLLSVVLGAISGAYYCMSRKRSVA